VAQTASGGLTGCEFPSEINIRWNSLIEDGFALGTDIQIKFFSVDIPRCLAQRGFRKNRSRKIWISKNLDTKILGTKGLGLGTLGAPDRHCLDYDRAI
jgi:hypothetical protein